MTNTIFSFNFKNIDIILFSICAIFSWTIYIKFLFQYLDHRWIFIPTFMLGFISYWIIIQIKIKLKSFSEKNDLTRLIR